MKHVGGFPLALVVAVTLVTFLSQACGGAAPVPAASGEGPAGDVILLANLAELARRRVYAVEPGATLRQVDIAPGEGRYTFRFLDLSSSRVLSATGSTAAASVEAFTLTADTVSVLVVPGSASLDLGVLRLGPDGVVAVMVRELGAATPRALILCWESGSLTWRVEVNGPKGVVRGVVADASGAFVRDASTP